MICSPAFPNMDGTLGVEYGNSAIQSTLGLASGFIVIGAAHYGFSQPFCELRTDNNIVCTPLRPIFWTYKHQQPYTVLSSKHRFLNRNGDSTSSVLPKYA